MYLDFYKLSARPFSVTPDPNFLYLGETHKEGLANLIYGVEERKGFILLVGEVGTGKTTLLHTLLARLNSDTKSAFIFNTVSLGAKDFFKYMFEDFGIESKAKTKAEYLIDLNNYLINRLVQNKNTLLVIDEAQNLSLALLEEIRLLSNLETSTEKLIQILLVGQPELDERLRTPEVRQLRQRIGIRYRISSLNLQDTDRYIMTRLKVAGADHTRVFTDDAIREIYQWSRGIPRVINILCDNSLVAGYAREIRRVGREVIRETAHELDLDRETGNGDGRVGRGGLRWLTRLFKKG